MSFAMPRLVALAPSGASEPAPVVAACRAGALGVLDFGPGTVADPGRVVAAVRRAAGAVRGPFGLRLPAGALTGEILEAAPEALTTLIVTEPADGDWGPPIALARLGGRAVAAEVTGRASARSAATAGAGALVVAGHEAAGRGGDESSFVLMQGVLAQGGPPVWVRGGIGPAAAAACAAAGAAGVVLDDALRLARESPLPDGIRERLTRLDGGETLVLGRLQGNPLRLLVPPGSPALARLKAAEAEGPGAWAEAVREWVGWGPGQAGPVGQGAAHAAGLARRFVTVGGIVQAVGLAMDESPALARRLRPLAEGAPLAVSHGTRYPIVQGPMTRVSDTAAFAAAVADGGALPFLALALLRGPEVAALLDDAAARLAGRPWGVGLLGFVPPDLRAEQVAEIRRARPPFALIAGGRPDQAMELERDGIATYLHAPSPGLLRQYLDRGARRFVLEGRECGGHVGPRSSFVLWEQAVEVVTEAIGRGVAAEEVHLLFAGGVHDARSAAAVAALAAPLAERGVRLGVLVGTAYLFTAEAVGTGAIVEPFQAEAVRCAATVLLETGPGHEVRVSPSPFAESFAAERRRLLAEGRPAEEIREALERLNAGRLRVAAKGVDRRDGAGSPLTPVAPEEQHERGLYMVGQVAALRDRVTTIAELHRDLTDGAVAWLDHPAPATTIELPERPRPRPSDIAIVGMAAILPGAADVRTFWENTLRGTDAITEVPADRWDWRLYYDPDPKAPDKISSKWGGFLPAIPFDPLRYGMPPASVPSIEPMQLLLLETVRAALGDAGYRERPFPRERTAVVLGAGGGAAQLAMGYAFRSYLPLLDTAIPGAGTEALARCGNLLPEWTEDSFPGILLNVAAGRVANRFDLGGANYTVDAACGSSLAAAATAVRELESGAADVVILGGADTVQNPFTYLAFSKTHAFSSRGRCRPFDASADGIVISEGVAVVVLKRLADAERDGDRIYAVLKGLGASSDGRARGLTAPHPEGQVRALERAYEKAGVGPETVGYVEAHGTGTAAGDLSECQALAEILGRAGAEPRGCAVGSVKSLIGHTKCAAGLAGLINAALALHHRVLPPTIGVEAPNPRIDFEGGPLHISASARPWLHAGRDHPRRAGVSAFGFGGTNFHAVLEAYEGNLVAPPAPMRDWPAELLVWRAADRDGLAAAVGRLRQALDAGARPALRDLAHTLIPDVSQSADGPALAIVADSLDDLRAKLATAAEWLARGPTEGHDPRGVFFSEHPGAAGARVAFVFPGQGAQYPEMLRELAITFPEVRGAFEAFDAALLARGRPAVGPKVFPPPAFSEAGRGRQRSELMATDVAQPAVGAACVGLLRLLDAFGLRPDLAAGHSYGELVALHAAGAMSAEALAELSEARGRLLVEAVGTDPGAMAALAAGPAQVGAVLDGLDDVRPVNWNGPVQTVIAGSAESVDRAVSRARELGLRAQRLPVACAFHSPRVAGAGAPLAERARALVATAPTMPVFANATAAVYPADPAAIADGLGEHLTRPVRFAEMIEAMYADGARVFVEVGPAGILSPLIGAILADRPHLAVSPDGPGRPGVPGLLHALGRLFAAGVPLRLDRLTAGRSAHRLDPERLVPEGAGDDEPLSPSAWLVDGARARPLSGPEPATFGRGPVLPAPAAPMVVPPLGPGGRNGVAKDPAANGVASRPSPVPTTAPAAPLLPTPMPIPPGADRVIESFQRTMQAFLEVQRTTMLGFLAGRATPVGPPPARPPAAIPTMNGSHSPKAEISNLKFDNTDREPPPPAASGMLARPEGPAPAVAVGREGIAARLLAIVRERTGYPAETLKLDLDLEADLGIDSIKRVEIVGTLRDALPGLGPRADSATMDALARARTLGAIVDRVAAELDGKAGSNGANEHGPLREARAAVEGAKRPDAESRPAAEVRRYLLEAVAAPMPAATAGLRPGGVVLVTEDGRGVARAVAADLAAMGYPVVRVRHGLGQGEVAGANLASEAAVAALLDRVRERGPLAGIVHALPLRELPPAGLDPEAWAARMGPEVRGLFLLARAAADDLARAARHGGACLIAATGLGGSLGALSDLAEGAFPGQGGVAGLVKTLAREWPGVRARAVDVDPAAEVEVIAADLVREVLADDDRAEVGFRAGARVALRAVPAPLRAAAGPGVELRPGEPLLVTGGARGITAAVVADLARRWRPTLLIVGTSPPPPESEDPATAALTSASELKAALLARLRREGRPEGPADVERAYQALRREREIRANLRALREAGARVEYAAADVRDAPAMARLLDGWRARFGPIAGLVHGAGVIQDKLLCDKTPESFDRVLGTKLDGALVLARLLDPQAPALRFAAFFSSVAGRFGNRGQGDYAAANEALNTLAAWLDRRWPGRVVSMIWGPWAGVGMVSDLEAHLGRRGLGMIDPDAGRTRLADELRLGRKGDVQVIVAAGDLGPLEDPVGRKRQGVRG